MLNRTEKLTPEEIKKLRKIKTKQVKDQIIIVK